MYREFDDAPAPGLELWAAAPRWRIPRRESGVDSILNKQIGGFEEFSRDFRRVF